MRSLNLVLSYADNYLRLDGEIRRTICRVIDETAFRMGMLNAEAFGGCFTFSYTVPFSSFEFGALWKTRTHRTSAYQNHSGNVDKAQHGHSGKGFRIRLAKDDCQTNQLVS